ncbi:transposase family protein [Streptomyces sp. IB201691-2A2]|uniref:transposase family protein n=1 Tax=Streptomyces sp. IB201691-2A2 TaxID=2561920 RepID=UPI0021B0C6E4|nr:transposase family protein [Streptomyces sp. IB201691-2A2]
MSDLRLFLEAVPDLRSRRGRWYSLTSILLVCAAAAVSGVRTIDELAEWGARADAGLLATLGVRRHLRVGGIHRPGRPSGGSSSVSTPTHSTRPWEPGSLTATPQ